MSCGQDSGRDPAQHLVDDLPVYRDARVQIQPECKDPVSFRVAHPD
jgi:hypothetical protein